jgi:hypothetical protein
MMANSQFSAVPQVLFGDSGAAQLPNCRQQARPAPENLGLPNQSGETSAIWEQHNLLDGVSRIQARRLKTGK